MKRIVIIIIIKCVSSVVCGVEERWNTQNNVLSIVSKYERERESERGRRKSTKRGT